MEKKISKSKKSKDKENRKAKDKIKKTNKEEIRKIGELLDLDIEMTDETIHQEKIENIDNENKIQRMRKLIIKSITIINAIKII